MNKPAESGSSCAPKHVPILTGSLRAPCPNKWDLIFLLPKPLSATSLFLKGEDAGREASEVLSAVLALAVVDVSSSSVSRKRRGKEGRNWKGHLLRVTWGVKQPQKHIVHVEGVGVKKFKLLLQQSAP